MRVVPRTAPLGGESPAGGVFCYRKREAGNDTGSASPERDVTERKEVRSHAEKQQRRDRKDSFI